MVHKSITILGSNGFVGSNLLKYLEGSGGITKDNYQQNIGGKGDVFINANGNSRKLLPESEPLEDFDLTVRNTLKSVIDFKCDLYIYISSCEVYGDLTGDTLENTPIDPSKISRYALSKYLAECIVKKYCENWLILRLNGPIGQNMKKGPIYDIINKDRLWMSARSTLQLIDMKSVSRLITILIDQNVVNKTFNVTGRTGIRLEEVLELFNSSSFCPSEPLINHDITTKKANIYMPLPSSLESLENFRREYET